MSSSGRASRVSLAYLQFCPRVWGDDSTATLNQGGHMPNHIHDSEDSNFEITSKRRKGFPSETQVRRGVRIVHGNKELFEKLGRNDLCPCGSSKRFKKCCLKEGCF